MSVNRQDTLNRLDSNAASSSRRVGSPPPAAAALSSSSSAQQTSKRPYRLLRRNSSYVTDTADETVAPILKKPRQSLGAWAEGEESNSNNNNESTTRGGVWRQRGDTQTDDDDYNWVRRKQHDTVQSFKVFFNNSKVQNVLKCSLAYFLGSLVVYTPIRHLYGVNDNKHIVATVATYFHPARTSGSMTEATMFVVFALVYSMTLALCSMVISAMFYNMEMREVGYIIDIVVFCGGGIGTIIFLKQRVGSPTFNTACTVACISLITILTREGDVQAGLMSPHKLIQNFALVSTGVFISTVLCYTVWPKSALTELKKSLYRNMALYSSMLGSLTNAFVKGENVYTTEFEKMTNDVASGFKDLEAQIKATRYELLLKGRAREYTLLKKMVASCHRLASHIGGLTSSAKLQWQLLNEEPDNGYSSADAVSVISLEGLTPRPSRANSTAATPPSEFADESRDDQSSSSELAQLFIHHLGPPLQSFSQTVREILDDVPFGPPPDFESTLDPKTRSELRSASDAYSKARAQALSQLYSQDIFKQIEDDDAMADEEGVAASCGNFSYVLEAFGVELDHFMGVLEQYNQTTSLGLPKSYEWMKFWKSKSAYTLLGEEEEEEEPDQALDLHKQSFFQPLNTAQQSRPWTYKIWKSLRMFRRTDVQFGIKVGIGAAIFAIPAFLDRLRPVFGRWRGEWGLLVYSIIMAKSIGGTLKTVRYRILGTVIGAVLGYLAWLVFPKNPWMLPIVGWVIAIPCFWIVLYWNPFGRFILLTFNITALYSYSLSVKDEDHDEDEGGTNPIVGDIAFHRSVSVTVGVCWALLITVLFWPNSARKQFRNMLSVQWLRMGLVWKSDPLQAEKQEVRGIRGKDELRSTMIELHDLLSQSVEELRLKGPYPEKEYKKVLAATQHIIDLYQNMSVLVAKYRVPSKREADMIENTLAERKEICSRLFLFFYLVSSAVRMGFPLPDKLPSTEHAIDRMLTKLNEFRQSSVQDGASRVDEDEDADEEDFVLFYSYILATIMIAEELAKIALMIQTLFGVIEDEMLEYK